MRSGSLWALSLISVLALAACNQAASPAKVQHDVAKANQSAEEHDAKAADKLATADDAANHDMSKAEQKADSKTTDAAADAVITEADGDRKVAYAKCEGLAGDAQRDCKKNADAQFDAIKAKVKALKSQPSG